MRSILVILASSILTGFMFFGISIGIQGLHHFERQTDFVILADKVGHLAIMTTFRIDPNAQKQNQDCHVGGDKLYSPWNRSVFTKAKIGDVLRRYRYITYYSIFGKTFWQNCEEKYMPVKAVSLTQSQ